MYLGGTSSGGFFPQGLNGNIKVSALHQQVRNLVLKSFMLNQVMNDDYGCVLRVAVQCQQRSCHGRVGVSKRFC